MKPGRGAIAVLAGFLALFLAAPAGAATVTIGQIAPVGSPGGCSGCTAFQLQTEPSSPSYVVPPGGPWTITSWSARGGVTMADSARLRVFRRTSVPGQVQLVAETSETPIGIGVAPFSAVSIPVQPGDRLGLRTFGGAGDMPTLYPFGSAENQIASVFGNMLLGQTAGPGGDHAYGGSPNYLANVAATLTAPEPVAETVAQTKTKKKCKKKRKKKEGKPFAVVGKQQKKKKKCGNRKGKKKRS